MSGTECLCPPPPSSYAEVLISSMAILEVGPLGRCIGSEEVMRPRPPGGMGGTSREREGVCKAGSSLTGCQMCLGQTGVQPPDRGAPCNHRRSNIGSQTTLLDLAHLNRLIHHF